MILPTKHLSVDRALIGVGGQILQILIRPMTFTGLWESFRVLQNQSQNPAPVTYDWFVLAVDFLFLIGAIQLSMGIIRRTSK